MATPSSFLASGRAAPRIQAACTQAVPLSVRGRRAARAAWGGGKGGRCVGRWGVWGSPSFCSACVGLVVFFFFFFSFLLRVTRPEGCRRDKKSRTASSFLPPNLSQKNIKQHTLDMRIRAHATLMRLSGGRQQLYVAFHDLLVSYAPTRRKGRRNRSERIRRTSVIPHCHRCCRRVALGDDSGRGRHQVDRHEVDPRA